MTKWDTPQEVKIGSVLKINVFKHLSKGVIQSYQQIQEKM